MIRILKGRLSCDAESAGVFEERNLLEVRFLDKVRHWALRDDFSQIILHLASLTHDLQGHCSVGQVSDGAHHIEAGSDFLRSISESDTLDSTGKDDPLGDHVRTGYA